MSFRENLQHMRAAHNMTQEQLAMLLGISRQSVTKWESEKSYPEMDKLLRMCQIFDCTLDELVQGDLTGRPVEQAASVAPGTLPVDVVGYDEHMRGFARKVSTGVFSIVFGVALSILFFCAADIDTYSPLEGLFSENVYLALGAFLLFAGVGVGLAMLIPGGMGHSAFVREHPYVEDFYTQAQKEEARKHFSWCLVGGIMCILVGVCFVIATADTTLSECVAPSVARVHRGWRGADRVRQHDVRSHEHRQLQSQRWRGAGGARDRVGTPDRRAEARTPPNARDRQAHRRDLRLHHDHRHHRRSRHALRADVLVRAVAFLACVAYRRPVVRHRLSAHEGLRFREIAK